jgi:hypothetical protein
MLKRFVHLSFWLTATACLCAVTVRAQPGKAPPVARWSVHEITLTAGRSYANPYAEAAVTATFLGPGGEHRTVAGFWDGGQTFRLRFTPTAQGVWSYSTRSDDPGLNGKTGVIRVGPAREGSRGFLRRDNAHPRHFVWDDGSRYFMLGTTLYEIMANAMASDNWKAAIDGAAKYGITKARIRLWASPSGGKPYPPVSPYAADRDHLNLAYWRKMDEVIAYLAGRGMVADLIVWSNHAHEPGVTLEQDERYLRYAVARYAAHPNVIWCLTNEWDDPKLLDLTPAAYWNHMGRLVRERDPWLRQGEHARLLSVHPRGGPSYKLSDQDWPTYIILQYRLGKPADMRANHTILRAYGRGLPVVNDEFGYMGAPEWETYSRLRHRNALWGTFIAGGYASVGDKYPRADGLVYFNANWHDLEDYGDVQRLKEFFTAKKLEYWRMSPHNEFVSDGVRVYVLAEPGRAYVAYAAAGGAFSIAPEPGFYAARRFDPRTGAEVELGTKEANGYFPINFNLPAGEDWVVYLTRTGPPARVP